MGTVHRKIKQRLVCGTLLAAALTVWAHWENKALVVDEYAISSRAIPETFSGFRITQISDLHNDLFGRENKRLLSRLAQTCPDIIVITGDLVDCRRPDVEIALDFVRQAIKLAPVYYVPGNHEARLDYPSIRLKLEEAGVTVLDNSKCTLERNGQQITLLGLVDPLMDGFAQTEEALFSLMEAEDGYCILLSHRPEYFETYVQSGVDLVFSGHAHGGQFRIPYVGGLLAPGQGLLPQYDSGLFTAEGTTMAVSRGLGRSIIPLRIANRPQIITVVLE